MADPKSFTQREAYIIAQALYEFIRLEQSKPEISAAGQTSNMQ